MFSIQKCTPFVGPMWVMEHFNFTPPAHPQPFFFWDYISFPMYWDICFVYLMINGISDNQMRKLLPVICKHDGSSLLRLQKYRLIKFHCTINARIYSRLSYNCDVTHFWNEGASRFFIYFYNIVGNYASDFKYRGRSIADRVRFTPTEGKHVICGCAFFGLSLCSVAPGRVGTNNSTFSYLERFFEFWYFKNYS